MEQLLTLTSQYAKVRVQFGELIGRYQGVKHRLAEIFVDVESVKSLVDACRFGPHAGHPVLGAADYKLVHHCANGRSVYSFCMCPGGTVVAAASEPGRLVTNGMSQYSRNERNANAGLVVDVTPSDYPEGPLAGMAFQRQWEERAFVERYVALERVRFDERLIVSFNVPDSAVDALVPAFALQTLVENALRHGAASRIAPTHITISAHHDRQTLTLVVTDDGAGANLTTVPTSGSTGLRRLRERLDALYGARAALLCTSRLGEGFTARLTLPLEMPAERLDERGADAE